MKFAFLIVTLFFAYAVMAERPNNDCVDWFKKGKLVACLKDCQLKCGTLVIDMGTFICREQCEQLCQIENHPVKLSKLLYYPGLTPSERKLIEMNPNEALIVYKQKLEAEKSFDRNFPDQSMNDEGDAFRHFIWAGLLSKELGTEKANIYLNTNETNPLQPPDELAMDVFNNIKGTKVSETLIANKKWTLRNLEQEGLGMLCSKELHVIKPALKIPENPK